MLIRRAEKKDIPRIVDLLMQINALHCDGRPDIFNNATSKYDYNDVEKILEDPVKTIFVADDGAEILGYVICTVKEIDGRGVLRKQKSLWIENFCVDEGARGQGIGHLLQDKAENFAKEINCDSLTLNVWSFNEGAIRFYESCGMAPQRTIMEKILK